MSQSEPVLSRNCAEGNHGRCLGTVYAHPPINGQRTVPCECVECQHQALAEPAATT